MSVVFVAASKLPTPFGVFTMHGFLDEATGKQIVDLIFTKHAERGMTLVLVTHDQSLAERCDRVVRLRSGRIEDGSADRKAAS